MSNLGFHIDANFEYGDTYGRVAPLSGHLAAVTVILNPNDLIKASPAINAAQRQALRFHNVEQNMSGTDQGQFTAQQNVNTVLDAIAPALPLYPKARWAYFRNEIGDFSKADFYALEMKLWIEGLAQRGYFGGICCWSFGTPDYGLWPKFDTALAAANANNGAVLFHEYGVKTMKSLYDPVKKTGHHCLRYRNVWAQNNYPARFPKLGWWVTETGLDVDVNTGEGGGWKQVGISPEAYLNDNLFWYDNEISKDGVSATVYQWGRDAKWAPYDIQGAVVDGMIAKIAVTVPQLTPTQTIPPNPVPTPEPPPPPPPPAPEWSRINISNASFEDGEYMKPDDILGARRIPVTWDISWILNQLAPNSELERHPTHVQDGQQSARVHLAGPYRFWYWKKVRVPLNYRCRLTARSLGTATVQVDAPSTPTEVVARRIAIDPFGTDWPNMNVNPDTIAGSVWSEPNKQLDPPFVTHVVETTANGDTITILLEGRHPGQLRADVFWDNIVLEVKPSDATTPPPPPPPMPFPFKVKVLVAQLNLRTGPGTEYRAAGMVYLNEDYWVDGVSDDAKWFHLRGQDKWFSRQFVSQI